MGPAQGYRELVAHLVSDCTELGEPEMVGVSGGLLQCRREGVHNANGVLAAAALEWRSDIDVTEKPVRVVLY
jgi:hypothetical protein